MKGKLIIFLKSYPLFLYLLPVFFVLHGCLENYDFVPLKDAALLAGIYLGWSIFFLLLFRLLFKEWLKAAIVAFLVMAFHFFFGAMQDGLRHALHGSFLSKYSFMLPAFIILLVIVIIVLKKRDKAPKRLALYLNFLFVLLVLIDTVWLFDKITAKNKSFTAVSNDFRKCADCPKPDIYLIIADEYAGNKELKDIFNFDDSDFLRHLTDRKFRILSSSSSNYNYTPYSIASTLNMDYLDLDRTGKTTLLAYTYETIATNKFLQYLVSQQYTLYNYSFFDIKGQPSHTQESFLPAKTKLITSQTFLSRIEKELRFLLVTKFNSISEIHKETYYHRDNNEKLYRLTLETANEKIDAPKFVLTHLMMPHYPYYYDKDGSAFPFETLTEGNQSNQHNYIQYLQYSNKKLLELVDGILKSSSTPPIIILMGDHGFRHFVKPPNEKYLFNNLVSVHLPTSDYSAFNDSMTNVNLLRAVLNTSFGQQLPYLKDTAFIMENP